ncbi:hypothetical protein JCM11251_005499 [Rhodosporidiobolus azoricus]
MAEGAVDFPPVSATQHAANLTMGPSQVGYQVQLMVFAVFLTLFCGYWSSGELRSHQRVGRIALWVSLFLNAAYTGVCFQQAYRAAVSQDRTFANLSNSDQTWNALPVLGGLIGALTEVFLAVRAGALLPTRPFRIVFWVWVGLLVALSLVGACFVGYAGVAYTNEETPFIEWNTGASMWQWASAVCDISISIACAFGLRSRIAGFNEVTDSLLRKLMMIAFRTASYTSILSLVAAICMTIWRDDDLNSYIAIAFWVPIPGFYGLSLFTFSAGSRRAIDARFKDNAYVPQTRSRTPKIGTRSLRGCGGGSSRNRDSGIHHMPLQIAVQQSSEVVYDEPSSLEMEETRKKTRRIDDLSV